MKHLTLEEINKIRKSGFRPQAVGCFLNDKKILFVYNKEYDLWQLPQGGVDNRETIEQAIIREMGEELGQDFTNQSEPQSIIAEDKIEFPDHTKNFRELKLDDGQIIPMLGKKYFFIAMKSGTTNLDISKTEFDDFSWLNIEQALALVDGIYQKGKKRITLNILKKLQNDELL